MLASDDFSHGDKVLIRFRLFADQAAHGWGWAIDNLSIQAPVTNTEQPLNPEFSIYPVPAGDELFVELQTDGFSASIEILDLIGHTVFLSNISGAEEFIRARIETALLSEGAYILRVRTKGRIYTQKFLKRSGNHH